MSPFVIRLILRQTFIQKTYLPYYPYRIGRPPALKHITLI